MKYKPDSAEVSSLRNEIAAFIKNGGALPKKEREDKFNRLAVGLFKLQFNAIDGYSKYCKKKNVTPENINDYLQIPPMPASAFKSGDIFIYSNEEIYLTFKTSGTSGSDRGNAYFSRSCAELTSLAIVENAKRYMFPDLVDTRFFLIAPSPEAMPNLTMAFGITEVMKNIGPYGGKHYLGTEGLKTEELMSDLKKCEQEKIPASIIAPSFAMVAILDKLAEKKMIFKMAPGSRVLDAGGFKGRSREVSRPDMVKMIGERFSIMPQYCINALGMSELGTQYYDNNIKNHAAGIKAPVAKENPHWAKTLVMKLDGDMNYIAPNAYSINGALVHFDLSNFDRAAAILTDDLGCYREGGFEVLGRIKEGDLKGCSLTIEELIKKSGSN
jgi:hypothetical protein